MSLLLVAIATVLAIVGIAAGIGIRRILGAWLTFRKNFLVTCPADHKAAGVAVNCAHAACTAWRGKADLQLSGCSRWPERARCEQGCLEQIERAPEDCLPSTILAKWYDDKCCVDCGQPVGEAYWNASKPVLLTRERGLQTWGEIALEELPAILETAKPVCFECYVTAKMGPVSAASLL